MAYGLKASSYDPLSSSTTNWIFCLSGYDNPDQLYDYAFFSTSTTKLLATSYYYHKGKESNTALEKISNSR